MFKTVGKILIPVLLTIPPGLMFTVMFFPDDMSALAGAFERERAALVQGYTGIAIKAGEPRPRRSVPASAHKQARPVAPATAATTNESAVESAESK